MKKVLSTFVVAGLCLGTAFLQASDADKDAKAPAPEKKNNAPAADAGKAPPAANVLEKDPKTGEVKLVKVDLTPAMAAKFQEFQPEKADELPTGDELNTLIHHAIMKLSTSGWREARGELVWAGKAAIPALIDSLETPEDAKPSSAFNLGGHTKADSGRGTRERPLAEVCSEVLTEIVSNHSDYKGDLPTYDQQAWQGWWVANASKIHFANEPAPPPVTETK